MGATADYMPATDILHAEGSDDKVNSNNDSYYSEKHKEEKSNQYERTPTNVDEEEVANQTVAKPADDIDRSPGYEFSPAKKNCILIQITLATSL